MTSDNGFHILEEIIRSRRTTKAFDGRSVSRAEIKRLLDLAIWAPNHRLNEPWKFHVILQTGILKWNQHLRNTFSQDDLKIFEKNLERLVTAGAVVYITSERDKTNELIDSENYAATSVGVGYLLLAATALKMQSYWCTGKLMTHPESIRFLNIQPNVRLVGAIWLGWGENPAAKPRTESEEKTLWID